MGFIYLNTRLMLISLDFIAFLIIAINWYRLINQKNRWPYVIIYVVTKRKVIYPEVRLLFYVLSLKFNELAILRDPFDPFLSVSFNYFN